MSLKDKSSMQLHPLSNGLIIGFKRPVLMIDVRQRKNPIHRCRYFTRESCFRFPVVFGFGEFKNAVVVRERVCEFSGSFSFVGV